MTEKHLSRTHLLAAEIFSYSFANYLDHLGIGNVRFDKLMPERALMLEKAVAEKWSIDRVAKAMEVDTDDAAAWLDSTRKALRVVDAENAAESFREAIRHVVENAVTEGFEKDNAMENLVTQICYRVSDLACLLDAEGMRLSQYSEDLRNEPDDYDDESWDEES